MSVTTAEAEPQDRGDRAGPPWATRPRMLAGALLAALVAGIVILLILFEWNWLRGPIGRIASWQLGREVRLQGDLHVDIFSRTPTATVEDLRIRDADWAQGGDPHMIEVEKLVMSVELFPLFAGRLVMPLIQVDAPDAELLRLEDGRANWVFKEDEDDEPAQLPLIRNLVINEGRLSYNDEDRGLRFNGTFTSNERVAGGGGGRFRMQGQGSIQRDPFFVQITGGPLVNVRRDRPYPFDAEVRAGATRATARGSITRPFDLGRFRADLTFEGQDLARVYDFTGLAMPNTPPYRLNGDLERDGSVFRVRGMSGRVGDSDLSGAITVRTGRERPHVTADLRSRRLDFDDLAPIFGGGPGTGAGETASQQQRVVAQQMASNRILIPDATLDLERLRSMDADLNYRAETVNAPNLPLRQVSLEMDLTDGLLTVDPLSIAFPQGRMTGNIRLDGRNRTPQTRVDLRFSGLRLEHFLRGRGGPPPVEGTVLARVQLAGSGNSVRKAVASSNGDISVVVPRGEMRQAFAELIGLHAFRGLYLLLSEDQRQTPVRCAVADFRVRGGVAQARSIVADTGVVLIQGSGSINLAQETMNLRIEGDSKKPRLLRVFLPVNVRGRLTSPELDPEIAPAVVQGGLAVALGALIAPLAAVLPFIEPGLADDANCSALVASANRTGGAVPGAAGATRGR